MSTMSWADRLRALYRGNNFLSPSKYDELADHIDTLAAQAAEVERYRALVGEPCQHGRYRFENCGPCAFDRAVPR